MDFGRKRTKGSGENIVPMINVVLLMLVFFLMVSEVIPPEPFQIDLPSGEGEPHDIGDVLYASADGSLGYATARGEAVYIALRQRTEDAPLLIRADARLGAAELAKIIGRVAGTGHTETTLLVAR